MRSISAALAAICLLAYSSTTNAHTWTENIRLIAPNGSFVGDTGYPRGFVPRPSLPTDPDPNKILVYQLPPNGRSTGNAILDSDLICGPNQQIGNQPSGYPALKAAPNDHVALRYEENGHVSQFNLSTGIAGKPQGRGTIFIYGTKQPLNTDAYLKIHRVWNTAGTGGDGRGKLLATRPFDDGRCFQPKPGVPVAQAREAEFNYTDSGDLICQSDVQIPADAGTSGTYTLYWVWEWPTLFTNGNVQTNQSYTQCMDIDLVSTPASGTGPFNDAGVTNTGWNSIAIQPQLVSQLMVDPNAPPLVATDNLGAVQSGVSATNTYSATFYPFSPDSATSAAPAATTSTAPAPVITSASPVVTSAASTSHTSVAPVASSPVSTKPSSSSSSLIATSQVPVPSSSASTEPTSPTIISTSHTSSSSIASSQGPQGFITVTVTATEHLVSTATVYVPPSSMTSITTTLYTTDLTTMTIEGPSPPQSTISTLQTSALTSSSSAASYINISAPSGKYTTNTVVPSVVPFITGGGRRVRGAKARL